ncbi:hypothetical protein BZA05DRAFT_465325 [Tricharina praecox]|uniref:uncharacterized protein n=1 Tax=Tricharina praecox TaxID=43433 RepID=UPI00221EAE62|nr:uncharacterized protein BZA05DRAFT_465325 [Tricharina praecox]KAI5856124.1 hypothetical protein BZA05DRAFT_465325 [Tricharina praecox]
MKYFKNLFLALISLAFVATTIALPVEDGEASEPFDEAKFNEVALKAYNEMVPFEGMYDALMLPEGFDYKPFELQDEESIELRKHFPNASIPIVDPGEHVGIRYTPSVEPDAKSGRADKIVEWHVCETSDASPWWQGIQKNIEYLNSIKNNWCCLEWPSPNGCQLLHRTWRQSGYHDQLS